METENTPEEDKLNELKNRYKKSPQSKPVEENDDEDDDRKKGFFLLTFSKYAAVIAGFVGFIALSVWILDQYVIPAYVHDQEILEVPDLIGMETDKASELLSSIGLSWEKNGEQYDPVIREGMVILQNPEPGLDVKAGRPIYLTISKGQEKANVPYLVGLTSREAMVELVSRGLFMGQIKYENSEVFGRDIVLMQSIGNGKDASLGDTVLITVSKGSELTILTPDFIGMDLETAKKILEENELLLGNITKQKEETFREGTILSQFPESGAETLRGTYIDLIIATSEESIFEDIQNLWDDD